jgi:hypothetical protein
MSTDVAPEPGFRSAAQQLLREWLRRARESQWGHYGAERSYLRVHYLIGLPLVVLTTFSGTSVFVTMSSTADQWFQLLVGTTSVVAAILGGLQTFLRSTDRAAAHRTAATNYASLRRRLEQAIALGTGSECDTALLDDVRDRLSELADRSPPIPQRVWRRTEKELASRP